MTSPRTLCSRCEDRLRAQAGHVLRRALPRVGETGLSEAEAQALAARLTLEVSGPWVEAIEAAVLDRIGEALRETGLADQGGGGAEA